MKKSNPEQISNEVDEIFKKHFSKEEMPGHIMIYVTRDNVLHVASNVSEKLEAIILTAALNELK